MRTTIDGIDYVDVREAALMLKISEEHVRRLARSKRVDREKYKGQVYVTLQSLRRYANEQNKILHENPGA